MALTGSPRKLAQDVAEGYFLLTPPLLRQYTPAELRTILSNLALATREIRGQRVALEDVPALKSKNMKLSRLHQAEVILRAFCKKQRIKI